MPTYRFKDKNTGKEWEEFLSIGDMELVLENHPEVVLLPSAPSIHSGRDLGLRRPDIDFNSKLKGLKKFYRGSNINTW